VSSQPIQLVRKPSRSIERERLVRRAKLLAWLGVSWHGIEAAIAVGAGLAASSIALIGFGADSLIESVAGMILLLEVRRLACCFGGRRAARPEAYSPEFLRAGYLRRFRGRKEFAHR
jgi:hypothetical protein